MIAEEPSLSRVRLGENRRIKLKLIQIGRVFLGNHPIGVVHLHEITSFGTGIGSPTMPNFTAEEYHIACIA